ncbi:MAG: DEAD/DEAH box helicase [Verrucomicrobiales bacterium]|jgi:superfamily II DNA or RNA helicase|nr:DEAD/DEAH box helicase [Verrucomicrobiales bacterium]
MNADTEFLPGSLVRARGREWVVLPESARGVLRLRPLGGSDEDIATLAPALENGAGPFRSFGNIAVEPRAYQLMPLLMALKLPVARLLIADDVGIGKTIEAGLIVRELLDRGDIARFAVLCPPHLVDQWQAELATHFHLKTVALTSSSVNRLERELPPGVSLFAQHHFVIVRLDFIKSEKNREHFLAIAPECVVVDEAHTCTTGGQGRQLRFELLQRLTADADGQRHLLLLTATPHSGDDAAFHNLLSLLDPRFAALDTVSGAAREKLRAELARHFVQRRRKDIEEWRDTGVFPRRKIAEVTYTLTGAWGDFFDAVQNYCANLAARTEAADGGAGRLIWYATLALLHCVASSPAAAERALTTRLTGSAAQPDEPSDEHRLYDADGDDLTLDDLEPAAALEDAAALKSLIVSARKLSGTDGDPKLAALARHVTLLVKEHFRPVIFCRYIATAKYVAEHLQKIFPRHEVATVTGELTPEEREERVAALGESERPILVATDCLSEGVNLQHRFTAVVHYDLAWNPTRHEQREGRVDRFGQTAPEVRCTILYGQDNPVDGLILNVILRKANTIRETLGVMVPLPENESRIRHALVKAALLRRNDYQRELEFTVSGEELQPLEVEWRDALEKAKQNRTIFAQRSLHPDEVLPEWQKQLTAVGDENAILRFVKNACARLNAPLEVNSEWRMANGKNTTADRDHYPPLTTHYSPLTSFRFLPQHLPAALRERLAAVGLDQPLTVAFHYPSAIGAHFIHRTHPLVSLIADHVLESALDDSSRSAVASRCAVTVTKDVDTVTRLFLLRLRHQLTVRQKGQNRVLMAEETVSLACRGLRQPEWLSVADSDRLLECVPTANTAPAVTVSELQRAIEFFNRQQPRFAQLARERAADLLADHQRVREAASSSAAAEVAPCLPVDLVGVFVLLPDV